MPVTVAPRRRSTSCSAYQCCRVDVDRLALGLAQQVVLGQRRTLVRPLVLLPDQHDRAVEALVAQGLRGLGAGQARPDDHVRRARGHGHSFCESSDGARSVAASCSPSSRQRRRTRPGRCPPAPASRRRSRRRSPPARRAPAGPRRSGRAPGRPGCAVIGDRAHGGLGHRVDHARRDQVGHVAGIGVGRVLDRGRGPQRPLRPGPGRRAARPTAPRRTPARSARRRAGRWRSRPGRAGRPPRWSRSCPAARRPRCPPGRRRTRRRRRSRTVLAGCRARSRPSRNASITSS